MIHFYGIPNCDTVKKARAWLDTRGIGYAFHDYKKEGAQATKVAGWIAAAGLDKVLNRRGTTFRKLSESEQAQAASNPAGLMVANPSTIKRPVVEYPAKNGLGLLVGFNEAEWTAALTDALE